MIGRKRASMKMVLFDWWREKRMILIGGKRKDVLEKQRKAEKNLEKQQFVYGFIIIIIIVLQPRERGGHL